MLHLYVQPIALRMYQRIFVYLSARTIPVGARAEVLRVRLRLPELARIESLGAFTIRTVLVAGLSREGGPSTACENIEHWTEGW